jgi:hypothetical protein
VKKDGFGKFSIWADPKSQQAWHPVKDILYVGALGFINIPAISIGITVRTPLLARLRSRDRCRASAQVCVLNMRVELLVGIVTALACARRYVADFRAR